MKESYTVTVQKGRLQQQDTFATFEVLAAEYYNYGARMWKVLKLESSAGYELTPEQERFLARQYSKGGYHWPPLI